MNDDVTRPASTREGSLAAEGAPHQRGLFPLILASLVSGGLAGLLGSLFRRLLASADGWRGLVLEWAHRAPSWGWLVPVLGVAAAAGTARLLVRVFAPDAAGSGIPQIEAVLREGQPFGSPLLLPVKFLGGAIGIGGGLALGREGPTVQMGAAVSRWFGQRFKMSAGDIRCLVASGSGAGLATAFGAPLSGAIFVLEELTQRLDLRIVVATLSACSAGIAVTYQFLGTQPDFVVPAITTPGLFHFVFYLGFGVPIGLLGVAYNRLILHGQSITTRFTGAASDLVAVAIGAAVGLTGWFLPDILGSGDALVQSLLRGSAPLSALLLLLLVRFAVGPIAYAAQTPGGLFAPMLVVGATVGAACGTAFDAYVPGLLPDARALSVVGMAAFFAATVRAPITGMALALELTAVSTLFVPMLAACSVASAIPSMLGCPPIYESLGSRMRRTT